MSDALYLSLWYPSLRLAALPDKLVAVLSEFARHGGEALVYSATVWPVSWSESPVFQQVYGRRASGSAQPGAEPRAAVEDALEFLYDDYAYEFQIGWNLWELETGPDWGGRERNASLSTPLRFVQDDGEKQVLRFAQRQDGDVLRDDSGWGLDPRWVRGP